jgi:hypothetical protein
MKDGTVGFPVELGVILTVIALKVTHWIRANNYKSYETTDLVGSADGFAVGFKVRILNSKSQIILQYMNSRENMNEDNTLWVLAKTLMVLR